MLIPKRKSKDFLLLTGFISPILLQMKDFYNAEVKKLSICIKTPFLLDCLP